MLGHEIDRLRCGVFGGHDQVAFIFAVFIIHHDHHLAAPNIGDHGFHESKAITGRLFLRFLRADFLAGMLTG